MPIWPFKRRKSPRVSAGDRSGDTSAGDGPRDAANDGVLDATADAEPDLETPVELPIDGELDLHHFRPREVPSLVAAYIEECRERGILELRVVHGKGKGTLRRTVHAVLDRMPEAVADYRLAPPERGGWGATLVDLRPRTSPGD